MIDIDNEITSITRSIAFQIEQTTEEIMFKTITDYLDTVEVRNVNKKELVDALQNYRGDRLLFYGGAELCPKCKTDQGDIGRGREFYFCNKCGMKILRRW